MDKIAIIFMFFHHFCGFPEWLAETSQCRNIIPISISGMSLMRIIAVFGAICVGMFTLLSGYYFGAYRINAGKIGGRLRKCMAVLVNYWIIMGIYMLIAFGFHEPFPSKENFIYNLFGMKVVPNKEYITVSFGWYIGFYLVTILVLPSIHKLLDYYKCDVLIIIIWAVFFWMSYTFTFLSIILSDFVKWGPVFSIGYLVAKYDLIEKLGRTVKPYTRFCISNALLALVFVIKCLLGSSYKGFNLYILYTPVFVIALFYIVDLGNLTDKYVVRIVMNVLEFLGKYSMNLWLLHGIFFTPKASLQFIAYFPKYGVLVTIWAILLLLPFSIVIDRIQKIVQGQLMGIKRKK